MSSISLQRNDAVWPRGRSRYLNPPMTLSHPLHSHPASTHLTDPGWLFHEDHSQWGEIYCLLSLRDTLGRAEKSSWRQRGLQCLVFLKWIDLTKGDGVFVSSAHDLRPVLGQLDCVSFLTLSAQPNSKWASPSQEHFPWPTAYCPHLPLWGRTYTPWGPGNFDPGIMKDPGKSLGYFLS